MTPKEEDRLEKILADGELVIPPRSRAVKTAEALQRSVDDLNDLKRNERSKAQVIAHAQSSVQLLRGW